MSRVGMKKTKKEVRTPISQGFAPKRLAINFDPPMIIMEYLVIDTGKLYHHKMRLDSVMRRSSVNRTDVLNYIKNKHHLYFMGGKIKDDQLLKFIDKIMIRQGKNRGCLAQINQNVVKESKGAVSPDDDFDYLNDDQSYEEDYEDYDQEGEKIPSSSNIFSKVAEVKGKQGYLNKREQQKQQQANWDLDMQDGDFDFI